jgi:hypothetical protein
VFYLGEGMADFCIVLGTQCQSPITTKETASPDNPKEDTALCSSKV